MIIPSKPQGLQRLSINDLKKTTYNQTVKILNYGHIIEGSAPADVIVLRAEDFNLNAKIELLGKPADVLIVGKSQSSKPQFTCNSCSFSGMERLIIGGSAKISSNAVSKIYSYENVTINSMDTAGVPIVAIIGKKTSLKGHINSNLRAALTSDGNSVIIPNGDMIVGSGSIAFYDGNFELNHQTLEPKLLSGNSGDFVIDSNTNITSNTIKFITDSSKDLVLAGTINTQNDMLMATTVDSKFLTVSEGIIIASFDEGGYEVANRDVLDTTTTKGNIKFNHRVNTDGELNISSYMSIDFSPLSVTSVGILSAYSQKDISNKGVIYAERTSLTANNVFNRGILDSTISTLYAEDTVANQYGGRIVGNALNVVAKDTFINGSRTPYNSCESCYQSLTHNMSTILPASRNGTSFDSKVAGLAENGKVRDQDAYIHASKVNIETKKFENINPYYVSRLSNVSWEGGIPLDVYLSNQVMLAAEKTIQIKADQYIVNSSAVILLNENDSEGALYMKSPNIINERYKMAAYYKIKSKYSGDTTTVDMTPEFYYYSPPGQIRSFGKVQLTAKNKVLNDTSFIEAYDEMYIDTPTLRSVGLNATSDNLSQQTITRITDARCNKVVNNSLNAQYDDEDYENQRSSSCVTDITRRNEIVRLDPMELDTLLYAGEGAESSSDLDIDNKVVVEEFHSFLKSKFADYLSSYYRQYKKSECIGAQLYSVEFGEPKIDLIKSEIYGEWFHECEKHGNRPITRSGKVKVNFRTYAEQHLPELIDKADAEVRKEKDWWK